MSIQGIMDMNKDITLVMTCCDRVDMATKTLRTFLKMNPDCGITKALITEDGGKTGSYDYTPIEKMLKDRGIEHEIIINKVNLGQIKSLDNMYAKVDTPYIFNLEDDTEWYAPDFVKHSMIIFDNYDRSRGPLFTVGGFKTTTERQMWIRPSRLDLNDTLVFDGIECQTMRNQEYLNGRLNMGGFALSHGLRETSFCRMWGPYSNIKSVLKTQEWDIGILYRNAGFRSIVPLGDGYCRIQPDTDHRSAYANGYEWRKIS